MRNKANPSFQGLVQRLVSKEKQVLQLQSELDRLRPSNPVVDRESVSYAFFDMSRFDNSLG